MGGSRGHTDKGGEGGPGVPAIGAELMVITVVAVTMAVSKGVAIIIRGVKTVNSE